MYVSRVKFGVVSDVGSEIIVMFDFLGPDTGLDKTVHTIRYCPADGPTDSTISPPRSPTV